MVSFELQIICGSAYPDTRFLDSHPSPFLKIEVGHWLGLDHTFNGDDNFDDPCDPANKNDYIDDTPQQYSATLFNCPLRRDSCPNLPGDDPVRTATCPLAESYQPGTP